MQRTIKTDVTFGSLVSIENPPAKLLDYCQDVLRVKNPEYMNRVKMGLWTGETPEWLDLYTYHKSLKLLKIPIGLFREIKRFLGKDTVYRTDFAGSAMARIETKIPLYDYQETAVRAMRKAGYGILQSKAGSGKTQMGIALACKWGYKTLWLTHTKDLLKQSYDRAAKYIDKSKLGTITEGKVNMSDITFATVQTMSKLNLSDYRYCFNTVIVDECHRVAGGPTRVTQFSRVLEALAAEHKYGLSATIHRADGLERCMYAQLGNVAYSVPDEAVAAKVMQVGVKYVGTGITYDDLEDCFDTDGTLIYSRFITELSNNVKRNKTIANIANAVEGNRCVLVLSDRTGHLQYLKEMIDGAEIVTGKTKKAERESILQRAREGKVRVILSTYSLAKEGLDIPCLTDLVMATPVKDYAIVVQAVGRVARKAEGKPEPIVWDMVDDTGKCRKMWLQRRSHYKKSGCRIL